MIYARISFKVCNKLYRHINRLFQTTFNLALARHNKHFLRAAKCHCCLRRLNSVLRFRSVRFHVETTHTLALSFDPFSRLLAFASTLAPSFLNVETNRNTYFTPHHHLYIIRLKMHSSCEIEDFVETHLCKLCVILRLRVLRVVCPH